MSTYFDVSRLQVHTGNKDPNSLRSLRIQQLGNLHYMQNNQLCVTTASLFLLTYKHKQKQTNMAIGSAVQHVLIYEEPYYDCKNTVTFFPQFFNVQVKIVCSNMTQ